MIFARFFEVLFLGFLCGLLPGPVVTAIFTETIRRGWLSARRIVLWAAAGELLMSFVCVSVLSLAHPSPQIFAVLSLFGALVLVHISWDLWRVEEIAEEEPLFSNRRVFTIAILNGMAWIFWITVCTPQAVELGTRVPGGQWLFILLFETGWLCSTFSLCYLFGLFRPYFQSNQKIHLLYRSVALLFLLFAVKLAMGSASVLLH